MLTANIYQAKSQLSHLVKLALAGEEIIISRANWPMVKLVPIKTAVAPRRPGMLKDKISISRDFDTLPADIARAFGAN